MTDNEHSSRREDELDDPVAAHRRALASAGNGPYELTRDEVGNWLVNGDPDHPLALVRRSVRRIA